MTFGKVIFKNYIKQKLAIFTLSPPFTAEITYKKVRFPQQMEIEE